MAGLEFDRQVFATATEVEKKPMPNILGGVLLVFALALAGLVGYKIFTQTSDSNALASANTHIEQLQQQLAESQKRLDELEKHHKAAKPEPPAPVVQPALEKPPKPKPSYRVVAASVMPAQPKPTVAQTVATPQIQAGIPQQLIAESAAMKSELNANHEAWQATTDRLADVVGVVGQQQNEITETRDVVNQLLTQNRRQAVSFELQRGNNQVPVGPVSLQLKNVDSKLQRYSVCVYFQDSCIQLKDRVLNEVVVFVVDKNKGPLELVATKVLKDQIVGYLQIPVEPQQPR
jgi:hypothetical protein